MKDDLAWSVGGQQKNYLYHVRFVVSFYVFSWWFSENMFLSCTRWMRSALSMAGRPSRIHCRTEFFYVRQAAQLPLRCHKYGAAEHG